MAQSEYAVHSTESDDPGEGESSTSSFQISRVGGIGGAVAGAALGTVVGPAGTLGGALLGFVIGDEYESRVRESKERDLEQSSPDHELTELTNFIDEEDEISSPPSDSDPPDEKSDTSPKRQRTLEFLKSIKPGSVRYNENLTELDSIDKSKNVVVTDEDLQITDKGKLVKLAWQLRERRNKLDSIASQRASKRDELDMEIVKKSEEAQEYREKHDQLNVYALRHKEVRNRLDEKAIGLFDEIEEVGPDDGKNINQIEQNEELDDLKDEVQEIRTEASKHHQKATELAEEAQKYHNQMVEAYREAYEIRDRADEWHTKFVEAQEATDRHNEDFLRVKKRLRELDQMEKEESEGEHWKITDEEQYRNLIEGEEKLSEMDDRFDSDQ